MSNDPREEPPEQPKTKEIPAARPEDILLAEVRAGFRNVNARLDLTDTALEKVVTEGIRTNTRLVRIEERVDDFEARMGRTSSRVKEVSAQDMAQDAQLAQERTAREELAKKVDNIAAKADDLTNSQALQLSILTRLDKITSNPLVKTVATVIGTALATWAASKGLK